MAALYSAGVKPRSRHRLLLLALGAGLLVVILLTHDLKAVWNTLLKVRFAALAVILAHLPSVAAAAVGWWGLLPASRRPTLAEALRLRLIKESINALLPVAQVGGDVVRARLAASPRLPVGMAAASCLLDVVIALGCLGIFICLGLAAASALAFGAPVHGIAVQLAAAVVVAGLLLALVERLGLVRLLDRLAKRSGEALGGLSDVGGELRALARRRGGAAASVAWHLLSWGLGVLETWTALWVVGAPASFGEAFVLESLIQGVRAVGFAIPGALGVQEGGYLLICAALGVQADQAVTLSLLRRVRELSLGAVGLALWRFGRVAGGGAPSREVEPEAAA